MPIEFECPFCQTPYKLKDEFGGKTAKCKNLDCRKVMTIPAAKPAAAGGAGAEPTPLQVPAVTPAPAPHIDAESLALSALADEAPKPEPAPGDIPPASNNGTPAAATDSRTIPMKCAACDHKWDAPFTMAGKNVLCPECRHRQKVPEPKLETQLDWRQKNTKLPSLAKQHYEKLENVADAGEVKMVSGEALVKSGAIEEDIEPRPLREKMLIRFAFIAIPLLLVVGVWGIISNNKVRKEDSFMQDALTEFSKGPDERSPTDSPLCSACLHIAAGEYSLRHAEEKGKALQAAYDHYSVARDGLHPPALKPNERKAPDQPERYALLGEMALATLSLGGTPEQVLDQSRYRWVPDAPTGRQKRINERAPHTVFEELGRTLGLLQPAEFDLKAPIARRLAREMVHRGHAEMAQGLVIQLFRPEEQAEAAAIVALEILRADKSSDQPRLFSDEIQNRLKAKPPQKMAPAPASANTLWKVLTPPVAKPPSVTVSADVGLSANVALLLLQDKPDEALALALKGNKPEYRLRALAMYAEWAADPSPALDAVPGMLDLAKKSSGPNAFIPPFVLYRLVQLAAANGKPELAREFADRLTDEGLKAWAKAEVIRCRLELAPKETVDPTTAEVPDDPKIVRVGHAWGRLVVARQNARISGDRGYKKQLDSWPASVHPFGLAGLALGLQDYRGP